MNLDRIGLVGYGEVGKIFCAGLKPHAAQVGAWDLKFAQADTREAEHAHAALHGITPQGSMQALCEASSFVISVVTASNTLAVAQEAARFLRTGTADGLEVGGKGIDSRTLKTLWGQE